MQVSGQILVLTTFAIAVALAGGAWWYNYQQSRRAAEFWGQRDAALLVGATRWSCSTFADSSTRSSPPTDDDLLTAPHSRRATSTSPESLGSSTCGMR